jgi:hypothetical protein
MSIEVKLLSPEELNKEILNNELNSEISEIKLKNRLEDIFSWHVFNLDFFEIEDETLKIHLNFGKQDLTRILSQFSAELLDYEGCFDLFINSISPGKDKFYHNGGFDIEYVLMGSAKNLFKYTGVDIGNAEYVKIHLHSGCELNCSIKPVI